MDDFFNPKSAAPVDPASDFLAREQALLGADAAAFGGSQPTSANFDNYDERASAFPDLDGDADGADDALASFTTAPSLAFYAGAGAGATFGAQRQQVSVTADNEFAAFENEYPQIATEPVAPAQYNGFGTVPPPFVQPSGAFQSTPQPIEEETEFIKSWRIKQAEEIAVREVESSRKKEETIVKAQNAIDNFYKEYNSKKEKNIAKNKEEEASFNAARTDALAQGTTWERICTLVELQDSRSKTTTKSKQDLTRFKEVLLALKREGDSAPGAGGY